MPGIAQERLHAIRQFLRVSSPESPSGSFWERVDTPPLGPKGHIEQSDPEDPNYTQSGLIPDAQGNVFVDGFVVPAWTLGLPILPYDPDGNPFQFKARFTATDGTITSNWSLVQMIARTTV